MDVVRRVDLSSLAVHREEAIQAEAVRSAAEAGGVGSRIATQRSYNEESIFSPFTQDEVSQQRVFCP